jgi:aerobic carbon-monoxide dehydrogenase large subunit
MTNALIGSPIERVEDLRFLRGLGQYAGDLTREGLLHAVVARSSVAHGIVRSIDAGGARALPGVRMVITAADLGLNVPMIPMRLHPLPVLEPYWQPVIAHEKVRYVGEPIAVVIAASPAIAEDGADLIKADIEPLPAVVNRETAVKGSPLLFKDTAGNAVLSYKGFRGDAAAAFAAAPYKRRERFTVQRHTAVPMEPRGLLAEWDAKSGKLTLSGAAKVPFFNRRILSKLIGLPEESIELVENDVGGGFGPRGEFYPEDFLIPFAARMIGQPVKWIEDRRENLMCMNHARECECEVEIACERDGTILGLRGHGFVDIGAYMRTNGAVGARNIAQFISGPYRVPNMELDIAMIVTNKTPVGTYRGPGRFEGDFFRERLLDMVAGDLGIDRVELRRRNLVSASEMPYRLASITPFDAEDELDSGDYLITLDRCLQEIGWSENAKLNGQEVDGVYHGLGVGCFVEAGGAGPKELARIVLESDGSYSVYVGSASVGQGIETIFAQIAGDALEVPMERIRGVFHGSTGYVSDGYGAYHSRSTVMGGSAILDAASRLRDLIRAEAAKRLRCDPGDVTIMEGSLAQGPGAESIVLSELAGSGLSAEGIFVNKRLGWAYGAHAAHVTVDVKTGQVNVLDYVVIEDVGRMINPLTLRGQITGATVQGLGGTFLEHFVYDEQGQLLTGSLADYLLPTASDFPKVRGIPMGTHPSPTNPLGAKGAGEGGIFCVAGVIANAVAAALRSFGVQPRDLPLSPPRIWELIQSGRC